MKKIISILFAFMLFCGVGIKATAVNEDDPQSESEQINLIPGAKSGILIEQSTGKILYEKEMDRRLSPASMTKIMTLLLIYEAMDNQMFDEETIITASDNASSISGSKVYLKAGEKMSVSEALKCICISSANDCAVAMAEEVAGSEEHFVRQMNSRAESLGCKNTNFSDCTGLSSQNHYTSAYDLAIISKELLNKFPEVTKYTTLKEDYIRKDTSSPFWLVNTNKMIGRVEGLTGLKTGYTSFSGYCLTSSMTKDNMSLISVVFGYDKSITRNAESLGLLKYGYANYKLDKIMDKNHTLEIKNHILYKNSLEITIKEDIYYLTKKGQKNEYDFSYDYVVDEDKLNGILKVYLNNELIKEVDLVSKEPIEKRGFLELIFYNIKRIILG